MILIARHGPQGDGRHIVAVFGVGLVGGAIVQALRRSEAAPPVELALSWRDANQRAEDLLRIAEAIPGLVPAAGPIRRLDVVWAAGAAGFDGKWTDLNREIAAFEDIVTWTRSLSARWRSAALVFHMLSSAGGLFEGQRFVDADSIPRPARPYGSSKLAQEKIVHGLRDEMPGYIYRPSSIYGFNSIGRLGLLSTLVSNAKKHATTRIFGGLDTVRDYVLSSDVGEFIARRIEGPTPSSQTFILASGKPASVSEMLQIARKVVGRPLYLKLDVQPSNASHITYRVSALPQDWRPTDLETGIRLVSRQLALSFEAGALQR